MSVTVKTVDLAGMLTDLARSTSKDVVPLNAVQLYTSGGLLVGNSTDRYVLAQATVETVPPAEGEPADFLPAILLPMSSVKQLLPSLKGEKNGEATLTVEDDRLHVKTWTADVTVPLYVGATFPDVTTYLNTTSRADLGDIAFGFPVLEIAAAVAKRRREYVQFVFTAPGAKPTHISVGSNYRAVLMPCRMDAVDLPAVHGKPDVDVSAAA